LGQFNELLLVYVYVRGDNLYLKDFSFCFQSVAVERSKRLCTSQQKMLVSEESLLASNAGFTESFTPITLYSLMINFRLRFLLCSTRARHSVIFPFFLFLFAKLKSFIFLCLSSNLYLQLFFFLFCEDFDKHEMTVYEEVARMPPFKRKTLVLVGKSIP